MSVSKYIPTYQLTYHRALQTPYKQFVGYPLRSDRGRAAKNPNAVACTNTYTRAYNHTR